MPTLIKAAVWNAKTEVGSAPSDARDLANFTSLLAWQDRLVLLRSAIEAADRAMPIPGGLAAGTPVLRLFMAPEYFFSESCNRHVMDYETRGHVVQAMANISANFPDMLLLPGTVSYFKPLVDKKLETARLAADPLHTSRLVKYAGTYTVGEEKSTYLAHNTAYAFHGGRQVFKYRKMLDCAELNPQDRKAGKVMVFATGNSVGAFDFNLGGVTLRIGVEICADHDNGQLSKGGVSNLDLQIVLSASTGLKKDYAVVRDGGCVFHCDAGEASADGKRRAWQNVGGTLVDLRTAGGAAAPSSERMDPLTRPELAGLRKKTTKLDKNFEKAQVKKAGETLGKAQAKVHGQQRATQYLQTRGGMVHFYEATIP